MPDWISSMTAGQWVKVAVLLAFSVGVGLLKRKLDKNHEKEHGKEGCDCP
jgi:hypothetical protein